MLTNIYIYIRICMYVCVVNECVCVRSMCSSQLRGHVVYVYTYMYMCIHTYIYVYVYVHIRSNGIYVYVNIHDMPHMPPLLQKRPII